MHAMTTAEIKSEFQTYTAEKLKKVSNYPNSVITQDVTISYEGTNGWQDIKMVVRENRRNAKLVNGVFQSTSNYADEIKKSI